MRIRTEPCPVCTTPCQVNRTRTGKPFWQCDPCGVQVFVRRQTGIAKLYARWGESMPRRRRAGEPSEEDDLF